MMRKKLSLKKIILLSCLFVFLAVCVVYFAFFDHETLDLSLFHFDPEAVESISLQRAGGSDITIKDREEINEAVRLLNNFKYINGLEVVPPASGWSYYMVLKFGRKEVRYFFGSDHVRIYERDGSSTVYFGPPDHFRPLVDLLNGQRNSLTG
jgi:hypothetical protein